MVSNHSATIDEFFSHGWDSPSEALSYINSISAEIGESVQLERRERIRVRRGEAAKFKKSLEADDRKINSNMIGKQVNRRKKRNNYVFSRQGILFRQYPCKHKSSAPIK